MADQFALCHAPSLISIITCLDRSLHISWGSLYSQIYLYLYVNYFRISPEELFLHLALDQGQCIQAEKLAIILGLDINALYLQVAEYELTIGNTGQAAQFFQRAKVFDIP